MTIVQGSAPTNIVTQALANVIATSQNLATVTGLPAQAASVQTQAVKIANEIVPVVQTLKQQVQLFVQLAGPLLGSALAALDASAPDQAKPIVVRLQEAATGLAGTALASSKQLGSARDSSNGCVGSMSAVQSTLDGDIAAANAERTSRQSEVDSLNKNKYYWLLLGPFGVIGLGIAIGELVTANNRVAEIETRISALGQQAAQAGKMKIDVQQLSTALSSLAGRLEDLKSSVDFVCADMKLVLKDLGDAQAKATAKAYLLTVQGELATLNAETA
jgi:hypothetical protein